MSRLERCKLAYELYQEFVRNCLLDNRSLLWPDLHPWTVSVLADLKYRLVDNPLWGENIGFNAKLLKQMASATSDAWLVLADINFIYYLGTRQITPATKRRELAWLAEQAGRVLPERAELWQAQENGLTKTGFRYHMRYMQIWLILLFAMEVKDSGDADLLVMDAPRMQEVLDGILRDKIGAGDQAHDMRAALLHLAFPDLYEPILSREDKRKIATVLGQRFGLSTSGDVDEDLRRIRPAVARLTGREDFHYFEPEVKALWEGGKPPGDGPTPPEGGSKPPIKLPDRDEELSVDALAVLDALAHTHNVILYGPPGTGKTFVARQAAQAWTKAEGQSAGRVYTITFHPNYSYEEFIEGLRPVVDARTSTGLSYEVRAGVFRQLCAAAGSDPAHPYVLIIDEINRGNIAKILGELMTLVEDDKRIGERNALRVKLPYSGVDFGVPSNVYIIGTMNTTDRSIALLDVALRRRFAFVELMPRPELLTKTVIVEDVTVVLASLLKRLNDGIEEHLGRDHQLGHSYFLRVAQSDNRVDELAFVWRHQIAPLLREYYYARPDQLNELLAPVLAADETEGDVLTALSRGSSEDLVAALARLAG